MKEAMLILSEISVTLQTSSPSVNTMETSTFAEVPDRASCTFAE
ncbi:MAG: hypothetical protein A4E64_02925 [Syntrophorhabdus sp. PtaU1.Bin058]|nr:MAG: hypothetical protein A4E64_02925 [Syntrophorhabdus sp. PtaU1.Bin058]